MKVRILDEKYEGKLEFPKETGVQNKTPSVGGVYGFLELQYHEVATVHKGYVARRMTAFLLPVLLALFAPCNPIPYLLPLDKPAWLKRQ